MNSTYRRGALSGALLALSGFLLFGCSAVFSVPAHLQEKGQHFELTAASKAFSGNVVLSAGPYELRARTRETEDISTNGDSERTVKQKKIDAVLVESGAESVSLRCVDRYEYTNREGTIFSSGVVDQFECEGDAGGQAFQVVISGAAEGGYEGRVSGASSGTIRSLHETYGDMKGALRGYSLGERGKERGASQKLYSNQSGGLWIVEGATSVDVAVLLVATMFTEGK